MDEAVEEKGGYVMTPPRLQGKDAFSREEEQMSRDITRARCYTEIMNRRVKVFKFLKGPIPEYRIAHISQVYYVCSVLANFSRQLVR